VTEAQVRLGEPEVLGQLLPGRLLDDPWAGERDQRSGLRDRHVAEAGEAGQHAGRGRVRENVDQRAARVVQVLDRTDRLRQLHQREDPFLHARSARRGDGDEREASPGSRLACPGELLADDAAHRAAHEPEVHHRELAGHAADVRPADDDRVALARLQLGLGESLRVRAQVEEPQWVGGAQLGLLLGEGGRVGKLLDALARTDRKVMAALRADAEVGVELVVAVVRAARRTGVGVLACLADVERRPLLLDRDVDPRVRHGLGS
jgi:hypothetical protein